MAQKLTDQEIKLRLQELNNLRMLHKKSSKQNKKYKAEIKALKENAIKDKKRIVELEKTVETLMLQVEELQKIVF